MRSLAILALAVLVGCSDKADSTDDDDDGGSSLFDDTGTGGGEGGDEGGDDPVDADNDGYDETEDCDEKDPNVHPFADEYCDGIDNDCDGTIDEDSALDATTWFLDEDGDGYGIDDDRDTACEAPEGYAAEGGDCDDDDEDYNPGAAEDDCTDPNDYNCDGDVAYGDEDEDGWVTCEDCDDDDPAIHPDATEVCDDVDNDCDGKVDDDDTSLDTSTRMNIWPDRDGDGYGDLASNPTEACSTIEGYVDEQSDCDDKDEDIHPGATEVCDSADTDEDCDGKVDDADSSVDISTTQEWWPDDDRDGYGDADSSASDYCDDPSTSSQEWSQDSTDCDDEAFGVNPGATEVCDASDTDEDCDGDADDDDSSVSTATYSSWYTDADEDGYGTGTAQKYCDDPSTSGSPYASADGDCDDGDEDINPDAVEICDAADTDEDCNGVADDDDTGLDASSASAWYIDDDGDSYGDEDSEVIACDDPSSGGTTYISTGEDCDDTDEDINPGETEICDLVDNDCDASTTASGEVTYTNTSGTTTTVTSTFSSGTSSSPASVYPSAGTYTFCDDTFYVDLTIYYDTDFVGVDGAVLSGGGSTQVGYLRDYYGSEVSFTDLEITDGGGTYGGAIYNDGMDLVLDGVTMSDNSGSLGGAIYCDDCTIDAVDSVFDNNSGSTYGGAIYMRGTSTASIDDSEFTDNSAGYGGGAIYQYKGTINATDTVFDGNSALYGGALQLLYTGQFNCTRSTGADGGFSNNTTTGSSSGAGAVYMNYNTSSKFKSTSCDFGTGADDNDTPEIRVLRNSAGSSTYTYGKGNNQSFSCTYAGCL